MTCESVAYEWPEVMPGAKLSRGFDFGPLITRWRESGQDYSTGAMVRVPGKRGYQYEATTGGQAGDKPVLFPTTIAATVTDGSVTWTCRAAATTSLLTTVATVVWTAGTGATVTGDSVIGQVAVATVEIASTVASGEDIEFTLTATMADGSILPVKIYQPVRVPERPCGC